MDTALVVFSRSGLFKKTISAREVRSREHARKLWPLCTPDEPHKLVMYVRGSFDELNECTRRSYFRKWPKLRGERIVEQIESQREDYKKHISESAEHKKAKSLITAELARRLSKGLGLRWSYKDEDTSEFHFEGDLLLAADDVRMEHPITTPIDDKYILDVAVTRKSLTGKLTPIVLGGIEIELGHPFDGYKSLVGKSLGFPLISVDISDLNISELTSEWAKNILSATTLDNTHGRRQTYVYLHDLVCPQFCQYPLEQFNNGRHQYLVFAPEQSLEKIRKNLAYLAKLLDLEKSTNLTIVNGKSEPAMKDVEKAGLIVGAGWKQINPTQFLRIAVNRKGCSTEQNTYLFHTLMARVLLSDRQTLVGYKYSTTVSNSNSPGDVWIGNEYFGGLMKNRRVMPKRLAEPLSNILTVLNELKSDTENTQYV